MLAAVLLAHVWLLAWLTPAAGWRGGARPALRVRWLAAAPAAGAPVAPVAPVALAALDVPGAHGSGEPAPPSAPSAPFVPATAPAPIAPPGSSAARVPPATRPAQTTQTAATIAPIAVASDPAEPAPAATGNDAPPVYATRIPPPVLLRYALTRGTLGGSADLAWRPGDDGRYELSMHGSALGVELLAWTSRGSVDAAGIAPDRFVDKRRGRGAQAVNFQRDRGVITFSGPRVEYLLAAGAQDRLSWLVQLAAIVDADPARFEPGATVAIFVAGARGDGDVWTFGVDGRDSVDAPAGRVDGALRLTRQPNRAYDTRAEVWLDPANHHLPVRARLTTLPGGDATEWLLRERLPL